MMIDVSTYIKLIMQKKGMSNQDLCNKLNKIEAKLGDSRTSKQNVSNYLNGHWAFRPKILVKYEVALGLPENTLIGMVATPLTKEGKKELKEYIKKVRGK